MRSELILFSQKYYKQNKHRVAQEPNHAPRNWFSCFKKVHFLKWLLGRPLKLGSGQNPKLRFFENVHPGKFPDKGRLSVSGKAKNAPSSKACGINGKLKENVFSFICPPLPVCSRFQKQFLTTYGGQIEEKRVFFYLPTIRFFASFSKTISNNLWWANWKNTSFFYLPTNRCSF